MKSIVSSASLALLFSMQVQAADAPPSTPSGLTATVFSTTAGEVRWNRSTDDNGAVVGYEVVRDGVVLGVWDALSIVETELAPDTRYVYDVAAIDNAGQYSDTSTVTLSTYGEDSVGLVPAPVGLSSAVYSSTAAEIFWERSSTSGLQYEVQRDGVVLGVTDGTSWFDDTMVGGTLYVFQVITLDESGLRSDPVTVSLTTRGAVAGSAPDAPANLSSAVYSSTAAEIFWSRPSSFGLQYEVQRDGVVLGNTDGISWFDDTLVGGTDYTFQVVAIDSSGRRSEASELSLVTSGSTGTVIDSPVTDNPFAEADPNATTAVARLGYAAARDLVDDLVSVGYLSLYYDNEDDMMSVLLDGPYYEEFELDCPQGGTVSGLKSPPGSFEGDFDGCAFNGVTLTGHLDRILEISVFGAGDYRSYTVSFEDVTIDAGDEGLLQLTGTSKREGGTAAVSECLGAPKVTSSTSNQIESARWEAEDGVTLIEAANWSQAEAATPVPTGEDYVSTCSIDNTLSFSGDATLVSDVIGTQTAVLSKQGDISSDSSDDGVTATEASLEANFGDSSTLAVTAISASESQVDIMADNVSVSFIDDYSFEAREDIPDVND